VSLSGVFLVIAPLSTLPHWLREFESWSDLNAIVYHGSADDRVYIRQYEMAFEDDRPSSVAFNSSYLRKCLPKKKSKSESPWMVQVIITTPEMLVAEDASELMAIDYEMIIVDEAHRMKNRNSKLAAILRDSRFSFGHKMLLTGTPIQNNISEFWTLLNFCDEDNYDDLDEFLEKYGDMKDKESVDKLHEEIRPYILRRLKEDVEKSVPPKEETLIEVELTIPQKQYYRALYEKNVKFLYKNKGRALDGPSLNNLAMQLRKCCNHVCLLNGVEEELRRETPNLSEADFLVKGSGKLVLLDKLLPRLKQEGHRVLLFSQFKIMLDLIEE
jgi:chromodomain-helicase-DNA-binding protein 7